MLPGFTLDTNPFKNALIYIQIGWHWSKAGWVEEFYFSVTPQKFT